MSHISRIKTKLVDQELLIKALEDLGYKVETGNLTLRSFGGEKSPVELKIRPKRFGSEIGFHKAGDAFVVIADWWGITGIKPKEFLEKVSQRYAYQATRAKLQAQGFDLVNEEVEENGQIHLVLRRMA